MSDVTDATRWTYKVVVVRWPEDEWNMRSQWALHKLVDGEWRRCRRDDSEDTAAFLVADEGEWLSMPAGEYGLAVGVENDRG